jgi:hypothetical protein
MAFWVRAVCCKSVGGIAPRELLEALGHVDFAGMAEDQGLTAEAGRAAQAALSVEGTTESGFTAFDVRFGAGARSSIRVERWTDEAADDELAELLDDLEEVSGENADLVRSTLGRATESVAIELTDEDVEGMAFPVAFEAAAWIAARGQGLVEAEGTWYDPETRGVVLVLEP